MNRRPLRRIWRTILATWYSKTTIFPSFFPLTKAIFHAVIKKHGKGKLTGSGNLKDVNQKNTSYGTYSGTWKYQPFFRGDDQKSEKNMFNLNWEFFIENSIEPLLKQISSKQEYPGSHYHQVTKNSTTKTYKNKQSNQKLGWAKTCCFICFCYQNHLQVCTYFTPPTAPIAPSPRFLGNQETICRSPRNMKKQVPNLRNIKLHKGGIMMMMMIIIIIIMMMMI